MVGCPETFRFIVWLLYKFLYRLLECTISDVYCQGHVKYCCCRAYYASLVQPQCCGTLVSLLDCLKIVNKLARLFLFIFLFTQSHRFSLCSITNSCWVPSNQWRHWWGGCQAHEDVLICPLPCPSPSAMGPCWWNDREKSWNSNRYHVQRCIAL